MVASKELQDTSRLQFRVETLVVKDGRKLRKARADADGWYSKIPVAALGIPTRNRTYYDVPSFENEITNPNSMFNQRLVNGQLYGELGHPDLSGMDQRKAIARLLEVREANWSHAFRGIEPGPRLDGGGVLLLADVKPTGNGARIVQENLEDPYMNTAFSLRSLTDATQRNGLSWRVMKKLVTFDFVGAGGYLEASKIYSPGTESFDIDITDMGAAAFTECSMENFSDTEINEFFGTNKVQLQSKMVTLVTPKTGRYDRFMGKQLTSLYKQHIRE